MSSNSSVSVENCAQAYLELLRARGVKYLFINPGTDSAPINEAFAKFAAEGKKEPRLILALHETLATSMAYGYAMVTGNPQVVMVHVIVGTANALSTIMNAYRARVPIVFTAGRTPILEEEVPGSRDLFIHWGQESFDQGSLLREFVKWDYEIRSVKQLPLVVERAFKVAGTEPRGPVYVILPRELLMEKMSQVKILPQERYLPPSSTDADPSVIKKAADLLLAAANPVIITGRLGNNPKAVKKLVKFVETLAIPVIEKPKYRMNFPTEHTLHLGYDVSPYIEEADVVLVIETDVPWIPNVSKPPETAKIIQIDVDPTHTTYPIWGFPVDVPIAADSELALPALTSILDKAMKSDRRKRIEVEERYEKIREEHARQKRSWREAALKVKGKKPIDPTWLSFVINEVKDEDTIIVNEYDLQPTQVQLRVPGTYFGISPAGSLGLGLGSALGAKLAAPEKTVIACLGDGSYIFSVPSACHWVAQAYGIPILTVIFNNRCYGAVKQTVKKLFPDGWSMRTGKFFGTDIDPPPSYEMFVRANRGYGETVEDPEEVKPAIIRALEYVKEKRNQALINVICEKP